MMLVVPLLISCSRNWRTVEICSASRLGGSTSTLTVTGSIIGGAACFGSLFGGEFPTAGRLALTFEESQISISDSTHPTAPGPSSTLLGNVGSYRGDCRFILS